MISPKTIFLHIIAKTNARWTTRDARSHRSHTCRRVFEPHISARCAFPAVWIFVRRSDDFPKVLPYVTKEDRSACGRLAYLWFPGPAVSQTVSVTLVWSLASSVVYGVLLSFFLLPGFASLPHRFFIFSASLVLSPVPLYPLTFSPTLYRQFLFSKVSFFCLFLLFAPLFFAHSPYCYISYSPSA